VLEVETNLLDGFRDCIAGLGGDFFNRRLDGFSGDFFDGGR
jgi:hypothetical protein